MTTVTERWFASSDGLRLHYRDYAAVAPGRLPVLCLPGLTRDSRDYADLASRLRLRRRVLCADLRGRGRSQHDPNWRNYHSGTYLADLDRLLADAGVERCVFVGTSLGGILTMLMAATRPGCVAAAILNDIGPELDTAGLVRIASYVGCQPPVQSWDDATALVRATYEVTLPGLTDEQWAAFARRSYTDVDGVPRLDMDPNIGEALRTTPPSMAPDLWEAFRALATVPTLVLRGATSDILAPATLDRMRALKPDLVHVEVAHRGHVPLLDEPEAVAAIDAFLARVA